MNLWKGTAVIKKDPVLQKMGDRTVYNFTACNTEVIRDPSGAIIDRNEFWLDCRWVNPLWEQISRLKALSLVYLEGACHVRWFTRTDGSQDHVTQLEVSYAVWQKQVGDTQSTRSDNSSE